MSVTLPSPTVTRDATRIVRDRHFSLDDGENSIIAALCHLRTERVTGQFIIDISLGGLCTIRFREEQRVDFPDIDAK